MIERVGYRPLRSAPKLAPLITAVGFSFILQNVGLLWRGGSQEGIDGPDQLAARSCSTIFGINITNGDVLSIFVTIPLLLVMTAFIGAQPPRQGDARDRAGPGGRAADGHQRRHDDLAHLPDRRHAGRRRRA